MCLIHPGEQEVIMGSVASPPPSAASSRCSSSVPSSRMVRSAAKLVSNTSSKPSSCRAAAIFPVTQVPTG